MKTRYLRLVKKQRGFTLIELLAVILILGIIALIAIPTVSSVVEQSRKGAFETTVKNLFDVIERTCTSELLDGKAITKRYVISNGVIEPSIDIKGKLPEEGIVIVNDSCKINGNLSSDKYIAMKEFENDQADYYSSSDYGFTYVKPAEEDTHLGILYIDPTNITTKCDSTNAVSTTNTKTGCMKFYLYDKNEDGSYDAILDHNTTAITLFSKEYIYEIDEETNYWYNIQGPDNALPVLKNDTNSWSVFSIQTDYIDFSNFKPTRFTIDYSGMRARFITFNEVNKIVGKEEVDIYSDYDYSEFIYNLLDLNKGFYKHESASNKGLSRYAWLYDNIAWATWYGANYDDDNKYLNEKNKSLNIDGYYTSTIINNSYSVWFVGLAVNTRSIDYGSCGIRPVVTIPGYYIDN